MLPVCDDDTDVAGVSAFNNLEKVGRIHLYSQFSGESLPENLIKRHSTTFKFLQAGVTQKSPACRQEGLLGVFTSGLFPGTWVSDSLVQASSRVS